MTLALIRPGSSFDPPIPFGATDAYEKLIGCAFGEVDPRIPENRDITDLEFAPRNARGMVEYDTGILILRPIDPAKGNHRLFYELTNRGVILSLAAFNASPNPSTTNPTAGDAGNGFLMREGRAAAEALAVERFLLAEGDDRFVQASSVSN